MLVNIDIVETLGIVISESNHDGYVLQPWTRYRTSAERRGRTVCLDIQHNSVSLVHLDLIVPHNAAAAAFKEWEC